MENSSFQESYPSKPEDHPPPYAPGPTVMQPSPYPAYYPPGPDRGVQQTLICQPTMTNTVVINGINPVATTRPPYKDYLCWSILNLLFCCCPLGVAAIVFSCKTKSDIGALDHDAAARNSRITFRLNVSALIIGLIFEVIFTVLFFVQK